MLVAPCASESIACASVRSASRPSAAAVEAPRPGVAGAPGGRVVGSSGYALRLVPAGTYTILVKTGSTGAGGVFDYKLIWKIRTP